MLKNIEQGPCFGSKCRWVMKYDQQGQKRAEMLTPTAGMSSRQEQRLYLNSFLVTTCCNLNFSHLPTEVKFTWSEEEGCCVTAWIAKLSLYGGGGGGKEAHCGTFALSVFSAPLILFLNNNAFLRAQFDCGQNFQDRSWQIWRNLEFSWNLEVNLHWRFWRKKPSYGLTTSFKLICLSVTSTGFYNSLTNRFSRLRDGFKSVLLFEYQLCHLLRGVLIRILEAHWESHESSALFWEEQT